MDDILSSWNLHSSKLTKSIIYVGNEANYFAFIEWNFELVYMYGGKIRKNNSFMEMFTYKCSLFETFCLLN